jgi:elongation factor P
MLLLKDKQFLHLINPATLDNGLNIQVPPFIESGDEVIIDTRTLEYIKKI